MALEYFLPMAAINRQMGSLAARRAFESKSHNSRNSPRVTTILVKSDKCGFVLAVDCTEYFNQFLIRSVESIVQILLLFSIITRNLVFSLQNINCN